MGGIDKAIFMSYAIFMDNPRNLPKGTRAPRQPFPGPGKLYGLWTTLSIAPPARRARELISRWRCRCACGVERNVSVTHLVNGRTRSCSAKCSGGGRPKTHGLSHTREYHIWARLVRRCTNEKDDAYHNYGGRGINVCLRWSDFENFYADMGPRPSAEHSVERRDNERGYEPANCYWATNSEQRKNRRTDAEILEDRAHGEDSPVAVLTDAQVLEMRRMHRENGIGYRVIARQMGLSIYTVRDVLRGVTWAHVKEPPQVPLDSFEPL